MGSTSAPQLHFGDESCVLACWLPICFFYWLLWAWRINTGVTGVFSSRSRSSTGLFTHTAVRCSGLGLTPQDGSSLHASRFFFLFFPCQVKAQNFSYFPALSKSFCNRNSVAATLPAMKHSQNALQLNTAVQQTRWSGTRACSQFLGLLPMALLGKNMDIKPNIFLHQTWCSNFPLSNNDAYMPKCDII